MADNVWLPNFNHSHVYSFYKAYEASSQICLSNFLPGKVLPRSNHQFKVLIDRQKFGT